MHGAGAVTRCPFGLLDSEERGSPSGSGPVGQVGTPAVAPVRRVGGRGAGPQAAQQHIRASFSKEVRTCQDKCLGFKVIIYVRYEYVCTHFSRERWFGVESDLIECNHCE